MSNEPMIAETSAAEKIHRLQAGLVLDQLLGTEVQEPDVRINPLHHLAVELEHEPPHAVRGRVLRPKIDGEIANGIFCHGDFCFQRGRPLLARPSAFDVRAAAVLPPSHDPSPPL
jgi:hypothetical protein